MFEQEELKNYAAETGSSAANRDTPELFTHYEIKTWEFTPRIYKILAASAVFCVSSLLIVGQTNLLTVKGCDSPLVSSVCQVIDIVYIGGKMLTTDTTFVDKEYDKTSLGDVDITYIDANSESTPLVYPDGYFALANPEEYAARQEMLAAQNGQIPGVNPSVPMFETPPSGSISTVPSTGNGMDLLKIKPNLPPPSKNAVVGPLPNSPFPDLDTISNTPPRKSPYPMNGKFGKQTARNSSATKKNSMPNSLESSVGAKNNPTLPTPTPAPTPASKPPEFDSSAVTEAQINSKVFKDFGDDVLDKVDAKKVDLTKPFLVVMKGAITKEGKLDRTKSNFTKLQGDTEMIDVAKSAIEAIGDSGILFYLKNVEVEKVNFTLVQDDKQIYAIITSDQPTEALAKTVSSGLNSIISIGRYNLNNRIKASSSPNDIDTLALLNAAKVESQGKSFVLKFNLDKPFAQDLINRQLQKAQVKRQEQAQPTGTATTTPSQKASK